MAAGEAPVAQALHDVTAGVPLVAETGLEEVELVTPVHCVQLAPVLDEAEGVLLELELELPSQLFQAVPVDVLVMAVTVVFPSAFLPPLPPLLFQADHAAELVVVG